MRFVPRLMPGTSLSLICNARDKCKYDLYGPVFIQYFTILVSHRDILSNSSLFCLLVGDSVALTVGCFDSISLTQFPTSSASFRFSRTLTDLYVIDAYMCHTTFSLWCHSRQCPWGIGSALAERGSGRVSTLGPGNMAASGLSGRSALSGPFLSSFAQMGLENGLLAV